MPQQDRHKSRDIPIEFDFYDSLSSLPVEQRCSAVLLSCGSATLKINERIHHLTAPCILCLSQYDAVEVLRTEQLSAKSFHFDPWYIKACLCFDNLDDSVDIEEEYRYHRHMLYLFTRHDAFFQGILTLTPRNYLHINELMLMIGAETYSQSDGFWTCRIRRWLMELINCLYDTFSDQRKLNFFAAPEPSNPVTVCTEYIHQHYGEEITLPFLCELVSLNRTSLNQKFKQQLGCTCMEYLQQYRLRIAQELLSNTQMRISEVAQACGFRYDSYFVKQFTDKLGVSPSVYRKAPLSYSAYDGKPIRRL